MCGLGDVHSAGVFIMNRMYLVVGAGGKILQIKQERSRRLEIGNVYGQTRGVRRMSEMAWLRGGGQMLLIVGK